MIGLKNVNVSDLQATQRGVDGEISIGEGVYFWFTTFDTVVGVREPNYGVACLSLCKMVFKKNRVFD